jgi:nucleoside-diphosphate-sugar epimerase
VKVLVTGATSMIGRAVVGRLLGRGHDVSLLQRSQSGLSLPETLGDITDRSAVESAVAGRDAVIHLAARVGVTGTWEQFQATNVVGTSLVVEAAKQAGAGRFVHISSPSVVHAGRSLVGVSESLPADPARARGHYARSKALGEVVALEANRSNFFVVAVRPHLVWGPGDTQLVGRIVQRARDGRLATIGSGAALIDTTYVDNAADAIVAALDRAPEIAGVPLVVTNGEPRPVRELFSRILWAAGLDAPRLRVPYQVARTGGLVAELVWAQRDRQDDPPMTSFLAEQLATAHWFSQSEARRMLAWTPRVSLDEGFVRLRAWFEANPA